MWLFHLVALVGLALIYWAHRFTRPTKSELAVHEQKIQDPKYANVFRKKQLARQVPYLALAWLWLVALDYNASDDAWGFGFFGLLIEIFIFPWLGSLLAYILRLVIPSFRIYKFIIYAVFIFLFIWAIISLTPFDCYLPFDGVVCV